MNGNRFADVPAPALVAFHDAGVRDAAAAAGRAFWRVYRQFKMYNDPMLNPYLRGGRAGV